MKLLDRLIEQAKNPSGFVGNTMLKIMNATHNGLVEWGLDKISVDPDHTVLDIGCGGGKALMRLSSLAKYGRVYGIDYSQTAVENSIKHNYQEVMAGKIEIIRADVSSLPFFDNSFNLVTAFQTHYFWPDLENDIGEVCRVLDSGGNFLLVSELYKINYHMTDYNTTKQLEQLFKQVGFGRVYCHLSSKWICVVGKK